MVRVLGWDTETTLGYVKLLRHSGGLWLDRDTVPPDQQIVEMAEADDQPHPVGTVTTMALLDALFAEGSKAQFNVFWNVRFDFGSLIKSWVIEQGARLKENHRRAIRLRKQIALVDARRPRTKREAGASWTPEEMRTVFTDLRERRSLVRDLEALESVERFDLGRYRILYIPKKGFRLTRAHRQRGKNSVTFYDAMPWYATGIEEAAGLDRMARRYLGDAAHKTADEEGIDVAALGSQEGYYEAHRDAIARYCLRDAELTAQLFDLTIRGFERIGIAFPEAPWSRASVGREMLKVGLASPADGWVVAPKALDPTVEAYGELDESGDARLWRRAYAGACILMRGVGSWDDVSKWDINSAYPHAMVEFPSLEGSYLVGPSSPEFAGCYFRFYEVNLWPTPRRALPARDDGEDRLLYVEGGPPRRACVTHYDLDTFDAWGDRYEIVDAVGVVTPSKDRPLAFLRWLYHRKNEVKAEFGDDTVEYLNVKIPMNGIYGILTQSRPRAGRFTNYIYGAYITAHCRRALWLKALELKRQGGTVLAWMTDGLFVAGLPTLPKASKELGAWDVKHVGLVTLFANGLYIAEGKFKRRGAPHLTTDDVMAAQTPEVTTSHSGPKGLKQSVIQGHPAAIGVFGTEQKTLTPAEMLDGSGLDVPADLRTAPLSDYFHRRWYLDHRRGEETTPRVRGIAAEVRIP